MFPTNNWTLSPDASSAPGRPPSRRNAPWFPAPYPQTTAYASTDQIGYFVAGAPESTTATQPFYGDHPGIGVPREPTSLSMFLPDDDVLDAHGANQLRTHRPSPTYGNVQHDFPSSMAAQHPPSYSYGSQNRASFPAISSGSSTLVAAGDTMGGYARPACNLPQTPRSITAPTGVSTRSMPPDHQKITISVERYEELLQQRPVTDEHDRDKHVCPVCRLGVARGTLRRHLQTHVPKADWPQEWIKSKTCPRCHRTLSRSDGLRRHLDSNICGDSCTQMP